MYSKYPKTPKLNIMLISRRVFFLSFDDSTIFLEQKNQQGLIKISVTKNDNPNAVENIGYRKNKFCTRRFKLLTFQYRV